MINKKCFTTEWINTKSIELNYSDKNLIEKVIRASKAAYLATCIELEEDYLTHYNSPLDVANFKIGKVFSTKLNKLKLNNPEAFFYWYNTEKLLS